MFSVGLVLTKALHLCCLSAVLRTLTRSHGCLGSAVCVFCDGKLSDVLTEIYFDLFSYGVVSIITSSFFFYLMVVFLPSLPNFLYAAKYIFKHTMSADRGSCDEYYYEW